MSDQSITIIIENTKSPVIYNITHLTANAGINIDDIDAQSLNSQGIVHLTVAPKYHTLAVSLLRDNGFTVMAQNHHLYEVDDRPGALAELAKTLQDQALSIQSLRFLKKSQGKALVSVAFDHNP